MEALVWSGSRLFSSGLHGEITEWDLNKLDAKVCCLCLMPDKLLILIKVLLTT